MGRPLNPQGQVRVLHVVESWPPVASGYAARSAALVQGQRRHQALVPRVLVTSRQSVYGARAPAIPEPGVTVMPPSRTERLVRRVRAFHVDAAHLRDGIAAAITRTDSQIVHVHWSSSIGRAASAAAAAAGIPLVAEVRFDLAGAMIAQGPAGLGYAEARLRRHFESHLSEADVVVAASHATADLLRQTLADEVHVVQNGVRPGSFAPAAGARTATRTRLGIPEDAFVVGTTSKQLRYEGLDLLLDAVAQWPVTAATRPPIVLFVGTGPEQSALAERGRELGVDMRGTGAVPPDNIPDHLAAMDIFVVPRRDVSVTRWASPLKVVEALDAGVAVLGSAVGDIPLLLGGGRGFLVAADAPGELASTLAWVADHPEERARRAAAGQQWIRSRPDWDDASAVYRELYQAALQTTARRTVDHGRLI